jgi:hypothetical protein
VLIDGWYMRHRFVKSMQNLGFDLIDQERKANAEEAGSM